MPTKLYISSIAKNDIRLIKRRLTAENKDKGNYFVNEIKHIILKIAENPKIADIEYEDIRVFNVSEFNINIHYQYKKNGEELLITAIFQNNKEE
ncbi:hypothetical protein SAMN05421847_2294 [Halpernia humi]|uniref:Type II toxin-antitoxin system RelE/ParE family toxin n=1 Tax=Halpernia humi TaxID=493375 RepID=A0A1H6A0S1_9FLAO|nr:hypothetical protein [Halpernia humi]SEG42041.1 hypothetical protein SAMN05421847_2294 [Halpernia humi]